MPLPTPNTGESQSSYISRCVSFIFQEGTLHGEKLSPKNPADRRRAVAACFSTWRNSKKSEDIIIHAGLKDKNGYLCRVEGLSTRHYYNSNDKQSKEIAKQKAIDEWVEKQSDLLLKELDEQEKKSEPIEQPKQEQPSYVVPKSKDELKSGDIISYKGKVAKVVKVLEK